MEGEAVEGNEEALDSAVLCCPKGILKMLGAKAGGSCCRCWGEVQYHSVKRPEPVSAALQVVPLVFRRRDVGARAFGRWWCGWVEGLEFVEDGRVFEVMASIGQEDVEGLPWAFSSTKVRTARMVRSSSGDVGLRAVSESQATR